MFVSWILYALCSGLVVGWAMHLLMFGLSRKLPTPVDMVEALGSYGTKARGGKARRIGFWIHSLGGALLGLVYTALFTELFALGGRPVILLAGAVLGMFHGLIVTYILMYWLVEHHPVEEYRRASPQVGLVHLVGHVFYGTALAGLILIGGNFLP
ncbi:MAG: hypothetical protein ACLFU2_09305 [Opitutales bacterium]